VFQLSGLSDRLHELTAGTSRSFPSSFTQALIVCVSAEAAHEYVASPATTSAARATPTANFRFIVPLSRPRFRGSSH
jgi:hypothetical protein